MSEAQGRFDFDAGDPLEARDAAARSLAVDPRRNVALEASAGTGKTRVLVDRYLGLLIAGVKPRNILAITFTRKAAAEMRQRILQELAKRHASGTLPPGLWREIRESVTDIAISTIDAFCLTLLREFPLEADVDPGFELADETETPRLVDAALERAMRVGRGLAAHNPEMALLFAELGEFRLRQGLATLIDRRLVAWTALGRFLRNVPTTTVDDAANHFISRLRAAFATTVGGAPGLIACGPRHPNFALFVGDLQQLLDDPSPDAAMIQALLERVNEHLLTQEGAPRKRLIYKKSDFGSASDYERHAAMVTTLGPHLAAALRAYRQDINVVLARAVRQLYAIALEQYQHTLRKHGVLDFAEVLQRTLVLLGQMEEFSRSRFKLEARYQHVLVDEFQDTSRAQWDLIELLVRSWAAGIGGTEPLEPSIFIVGDRKQSIYGFRDAEVAILDEASRYIGALRPAGPVRTAITRSFRSVRELLSFVNDLFSAIEKVPDRSDAFRYSEDDLFPVSSVESTEANAMGIVSAASDQEQADAVADEIARLLQFGETVRDRDSGLRRPVRPGDIGILFRTRDGHRLFEDALARRSVPYYVYKGIGFFDADEIKDVLAVLAFLARPHSELHAAAFLRSRFVGLSDEALKILAPGLSGALTASGLPASIDQLNPTDRRRLGVARRALASWLPLVDRLPPAELLDRVLAEAAYAAEIGGPAYRQSRENLKKVRGFVRRMQNRGYATIARVVDHFTQLVAGGDESNAIVDAVDAVNLMTAHAAKGLEFPIVFVVNLNRGSGGGSDPIRVFPPAGGDDSGEPSVAVGDYEGEIDRDLDARETEEGKRLLYVAVTRARDRLYLAATLNADGRFAPLKGGLGRSLPPNFGELFAAARTAEGRTIWWRGSSMSHEFRVIRPAEAAAVLHLAIETPAALDDFSPVAATGRRRVAVTEFDPTNVASVLPAAPAAPVAPVAPAASAAPAAPEAPASPDVGFLVHRAVARGWLDRPIDCNAASGIERLLRDDERSAIENVPALIRGTLDSLSRLREHPDLKAYSDGSGAYDWRRHEVPFSLLATDGSILRGVIDCVVKHDQGIDVIEFKTGRPQPDHERQLAVYVEAAQALFSEFHVTGRLIYTH